MNNQVKKKNSFPLEFQAIKKNAKVDKKNEVFYDKRVSVLLYQSNNVTRENFYKPISKIINFEY